MMLLLGLLHVISLCVFGIHYIQDWSTDAWLYIDLALAVHVAFLGLWMLILF